jgi:flagellar FliL protein
MSDKPAAEAKPADGAPKASTPKPILLLLVLNLGMGGFATFKLATAAEAAPAKPAEAAAPAGNEIHGPVVSLDPFVVNLDEPGTSRYLKVSVQLEVQDKEVEEALEKNKQLVRDEMLSYLSGLHVKDTLGTEGKDKIRKDLLASLDKSLGQGRVHRMFFNEFVVQ